MMRSKRMNSGSSSAASAGSMVTRDANCGSPMPSPLSSLNKVSSTDGGLPLPPADRAIASCISCISPCEEAELEEFSAGSGTRTNDVEEPARRCNGSRGMEGRIGEGALVTGAVYGVAYGEANPNPSPSRSPGEVPEVDAAAVGWEAGGGSGGA
jgi:hypothetical protein